MWVGVYRADRKKFVLFERISHSDLLKLTKDRTGDLHWDALVYCSEGVIGVHRRAIREIPQDVVFGSALYGTHHG